MTNPNSLTAKSKKIAIVFDDTIDRSDGVQQYVKAIAKGLVKSGHLVEIWCSDSQTSEINGAKVRSLSHNVRVKGNGNSLTMPALAHSKAIRRAFDDFQPDIIHVQMPYSPLLAGRIMARAHKLGVRIVGTFHIHASDNLFVMGNRLLAKLQVNNLKKIDAVCAVSPAAARYCKDVYNIDTRIIPNTVDLDFDKGFKPQTVTTRPYLLSMGRLDERKGAQLLLAALPRVLQELPDLDVVFAGGGPLLNRLRDQAKPLKDRVHFTGRFAESDKAGLLHGADIAIYPAFKGESFGIVLIEAFSANNPLVIAGRNAGYDYVMQPISNQQVDPHDTVVLAQKIIDTYRLNRLQKQTIRSAQTKRLQDFTIDTVIPRLERLYLQ